MTQEQLYFVRVLSNHLSGQRSEPIIDVNWESIRELSRNHQVEGIVYYQCKDFMPTGVLAKYEHVFNTTLFYFKNREKSIEIIKRAFDDDLPFFTVKGIEIAQYYPVPALRTMGDSDIVIHEKDKEKAGNILNNLGFKYKSEFVGKEQIYSYCGMDYDLHYQLVYDEPITMPEQKLFFNNCWEYVYNGKLEISFHFLFLLVHLRKHLMNEGVGIRQFMDVAVMVKNEKNLDWQWIVEKMIDLKLMKFAGICFALIDKWFEIKAPIEPVTLEDGFIERATEKIIANGVFGFEDKNNDSNNYANIVRQFRGPRWMARGAILFERLFPKYEYLRSGKSYKFMNNRPWLLPVAWGYRFYLMLNGKTTSGLEIMKRIATPNGLINTRENELREWGLIE